MTTTPEKSRPDHAARKAERARRLRALLRRQHGVISLAQALELGFTHQAVRRRVLAGTWRRLAPRVYQDATHEQTPVAETWAVMLSLGDGSVLVGRSAAWWWGLLPARPEPTEVAVPRSYRPEPRAGAAMTQRDVPPRDTTRHRGLRVTITAATVLDAAAVLGEVEGARLMDRALQERRVNLATLRREQAARRGRPGVRLTARLLALAEGGAVSEAERRTHTLLTGAGITGWEANGPVEVPGFGRAEGDLVFRREKVLLEVDGWAYHRGQRAFLLDGPRQNALAAAGWIVLRTHWFELTEQPEVFLDTLRRVLATRR